jgi:hypothetical protein
MVSRIKYDTLPKFNRKDLVAHPWKAVGVVLGALIVIFSKGEYLFAVLAVFIAWGVVRAVFKWFKGYSAGPEKEAEEETEIPRIDI